MARPLAVLPFLTGDPIRLGPDITTFTELVAALDVAFTNPRVFVGIAAELGLLTALILIPLHAVFNTAALSFSEWCALLALPPLMLALEQGPKWVTRCAGVGGA